MEGSNKQKHTVVAVIGPTASGKTALSIALARQFGGEIISADSMQIYRGLDVGTAKVTAKEAMGVPHHCVDIRSPEQTFSVAEFVSLAQQLEAEIAGRGHLPIICGGTGLYVQSFLSGVQFAEERADAAVRAALAEEARLRGPQAMYEELLQVDPEAARATHPNNCVRVLRALEHYRSTGQTLTRQKAESLPPEPPYRSLIFGLDFADRAALYARIDCRAEQMVQNGIVEEARLVYENRERYKTAVQAIGYKEFFPYFDGTSSLEACVEELKKGSRHYAKRQLTWFRRMKDIIWLEASDPQQALRRAAERTEQHLRKE